MITRYFALVFGIVYLLVGIVGFIPALYTHPPANAPAVAASGGYGYLFGLFPINYLHDIVHILVGVLGLLAYPRFSLAVAYSRTVALVYTLLVVLGFFPPTNTLFGLVPLFGNDTWLHAGSALVLAYFGWVAGAPTHEEAAHPA